MDYKKAGVDIEAGYKSVELMKKHIAKTMRPEVLGGMHSKIWKNQHSYPVQMAAEPKLSLL